MNADIDVNDALREYSSLGNEEEVLKQLHNGAAINSQNRVNGWTALHLAARREHITIVNLLLEKGADVNVRNHKGEKAVDVATNEEIKIALETAEKNYTAKQQTPPSSTPDTASASRAKHLVDKPVNLLTGYIANPVFPYTLAKANPVLRSPNNTGESSVDDQALLLPGYIANPVYAVAAGNSVAAESNVTASQVPNNDGPVNLISGYLANPVYALATESAINAEDATTKTDATKIETPVNFVPGYIANPVFPYAVGTPALANEEAHEEFKQIFVPHVEQFGSLVNTYVNSVQSLGKHIEYRMCDSCHTTPVANVFVGTNVSEIVLKVRQANLEDNDFIEIELNRKILTYDQLLDVCCKELRINRSEIKKIRKLPNTVIRRDKDVKKLQPYQELEIVLS